MTGALAIARDVRDGRRSAQDVLDETLARIAARDGAFNSFVTPTHERARREAAEIDRRRAAGDTLPALAGVPYAVKNLFDVEGVVTLAGGAVNRNNPPAPADAVLVSRMHDAGAVLVGTLNMDEHAYGFTTENSHFGPTRNPHDPARSAGGSSGGSAAAVAAGLVPITLGSDTNGSIRVPSSLCGTFGLKPTFGRLPRRGTFPFVASLDHLGPFAATVIDLAAAYDALQGADVSDPACAQRPLELVSARLPSGDVRLDPARIAVLGGYFEEWASAPARDAVQRAATTLGASATVDLDGAARARAAAFVITAAEGGALHAPRLRTRYAEFEPHSRDRLVAGSLIPAAWVVQAQRVRRQFYCEAMRGFERYDLLLAPATPVTAPLLGTESIEINGRRVPCRPSLGLLTQPVSCIGLPVCAVPLWPSSAEGLPIGVQLIAPPWREDLCLAAAKVLEDAGVALCKDRLMEIDLPDVMDEVSAAVDRYEVALVSNDVAVLDELFWNDSRTLRYGATENLYGYDEIMAFRAGRSPLNLRRAVIRRVITTYGRDFATANLEFRRDGDPRTGRQSQTWVRMAEGWRVVAAHVSLKG